MKQDLWGKRCYVFIKPTGITGKKNAFRHSLFSGLKQKKQKQKVGKISLLFLPFNWIIGKKSAFPRCKIQKDIRKRMWSLALCIARGFDLAPKDMYSMSVSGQ